VGITNRVDSARGILYETWTGRITRDIIADYWREFVNDPAIQLCTKDLTDVREAEPDFTDRELRDLIHSILLPAANKFHGLRTAILVGSAEQYGISRQYTVFAEYFGEAAIFTDEERAREWLGI
jgi:hypothetical protein